MIKSSQRQIFTVKKDTIGRVQSFKYLGRYIGSDNDDWTTVRYNIKKDGKSWMRVKTILLCGNFSGKVMGNFYKVIVISVILYG